MGAVAAVAAVAVMGTVAAVVKGVKGAKDFTHLKEGDTVLLRDLTVGTIGGFDDITRENNIIRIHINPANKEVGQINYHEGYYYYDSDGKFRVVDSKTPPKQLDVLYQVTPETHPQCFI